MYHLRRAIKEGIKLLGHLDITEVVEGQQNWKSNLVVVPKYNGIVRLYLDAWIINTTIRRTSHTNLNFDN